MEIYGVTDHMREVASCFAEQGFIAFVPNFYWRHLPEADLPYDAGGRELGMSLIRQLQRESVIDDISATMNYLGHFFRQYDAAPVVSVKVSIPVVDLLAP
jgi:carboxymethylenebutenolidase